jgi:hypothetical protein
MPYTTHTNRIATSDARPIPGGWRVRERFQGWHFRVEPVPGRLRVVMSGHGGAAGEWLVPG